MPRTKGPERVRANLQFPVSIHDKLMSLVRAYEADSISQALRYAISLFQESDTYRAEGWGIEGLEDQLFFVPETVKALREERKRMNLVMTPSHFAYLKSSGEEHGASALEVACWSILVADKMAELKDGRATVYARGEEKERVIYI